MGLRAPRPAWLLALLGFLVASAGAPQAVAQGTPVLVFAAASLKNALDEANVVFERAKGVKANTAYAASSALAKQIEAGAPADLFISADLDWMDYVEQKKLIKSPTRSNLLGNKIVLIAPAKSTVQLTIGPNFPLAQALGDGRLAMADTASVPAGKYGKAALEALGVWPSVAAKIAPAENVPPTLLLVSLGDAPPGLVYQTDAVVDPNVRILGSFPANTHP